MLGLASVDAGRGWLIFALPPAEAAFHPAEENDRHELYFLCSDLKAEMSALAKKNVACRPFRRKMGSIPGSAFLGRPRRLVPTKTSSAFPLP